MNNSNDKKPEILAPAGSFEAFVAAVHNGCDAVYLGGKQFGARAYANNFDHAAIKRTVDYSRLFNVKIYYTVNTMIKQDEIPSLLEEINELRTLGIHAFILQDIGAIKLLGDVFGDIELHASTQMNCHSIHGVDFLKKLGVCRVVLSRELSLMEIKKIKKETTLEIETFVHGALCYCYSGQCLMSSFLGGRSGNRGRCAQPCRLKYKTIIDGEVVDDSHILSPKDIETLTILPDLIDGSIDAFKIEGRMKSKEYVGLMTKLYRYYTDQFIKEGYIHIKQEDIRDMNQIFNRGEFSNGYYYQHNGLPMMTVNQPKHQGVVIGKVKKSKGLSMVMTLFEEIQKGDCLEVPLVDGSRHSFIVDSHMKGERSLLIRTQSLPVQGAEIRRIKSVELNDRITEENNTIDQPFINMEVSMHKDRPMLLRIYDEEREIEVEGDVVQEAKTQELTIDRIKKQFSKVGQYPIMINRIDIIKDEGIFVPVGHLNNLRRIGLEQWFGINNEVVQKVELPNMLSYKNKKAVHRNITVLLKNRNQFDVVKGYDIKRVYLEWFNFEREDIDEIVTICEDQDIELFVALPRIVREEKEPMLKLLIENIPSKINGFLVRSMDCYNFVQSYHMDKMLVWDYSMNIANGYSVQYLLDRPNAIGYCPSLELNRRDINRLPLEQAEYVIYGNAKVMTTAQCIRMNTSGCVKEPGKILYLKDRKGIHTPVETVCQLCYNNTYNGIPHYLVDKINELQRFGISTFRIDLLDEAPEVIHRILEAAFLEDTATCKPMLESFTRGHYNKGIE